MHDGVVDTLVLGESVRVALKLAKVVRGKACVKVANGAQALESRHAIQNAHVG
jgi:hypothetical protein